jgi:hypothetical protein
MAQVINSEQLELAQNYQAHLQTQNDLNLLLKVINENHNHNFFSKLWQKISKKPCKICTAYKRIING